MARGESPEQIILEYQKAFGVEASSRSLRTAGAMRAIYAVPIVAIVGGAVGSASPSQVAEGGAGSHVAAANPRGPARTPRDDYDARLDDELKDLDD
jgi:hypothetical protein